MWRTWMLVAALAAAASAVAAAEPPLGTITILEGDALIYRDAGRVHAAGGVRLVPGDIVETSSPGAFAQVEMPDGSVLDLAGPSRVMFGSTAQRRKPAERWLYVMSGWLKWSGAKRGADAPPGLELRTPLAELPAHAGVVVLRAAPAELALFVEREGGVRIAERGAGAAPGSVALRGGDGWARKAGVRGAVRAGVDPAFVAAMPKAFRDSIPLRADRWADQDVTPKEAPDFAYADVEDWLKAEAPLRRSLLPRWRAKAREPEFRAALVANLRAHPEWDPVLFPEKYLPKKPPAPPHPVASAPAASALALPTPQ